MVIKVLAPRRFSGVFLINHGIVTEGLACHVNNLFYCWKRTCCDRWFHRQRRTRAGKVPTQHGPWAPEEGPWVKGNPTYWPFYSLLPIHCTGGFSLRLLPSGSSPPQHPRKETPTAGKNPTHIQQYIYINKRTLTTLIEEGLSWFLQHDKEPSMRFILTHSEWRTSHIQRGRRNKVRRSPFP